MRLISTGNEGFGIKAEQESVGSETGTIYLLGVDLTGKTDGEVDADGVPAIGP